MRRVILRAALPLTVVVMLLVWVGPGPFLRGIAADHLELACAYTLRQSQIAADAAVLVTARLPEDRLYLDLKAREGDWRAAGIASVKLIGDAAAPAPIAWAVYAGHRYARELDEPDLGDAPPFRREIAQLAPP